MLVCFDMQMALGCFAGKWYMDQFFYKHEDAEMRRLFKTNIANTFLYRANQSFFERTFLSAADHIHEELNREPKMDFKVLHRWDLKNHRDFLSHPGLGGQFENPQMKKFVEEKRYYKEPKAVQLWNARRSILDKLTELGSQRPAKDPSYVGFPSGMVELVHGAINHSLNDDIIRPSMDEVRNSLVTFFKEFQAHLVKEADKAFSSGG